MDNISEATNTFDLDYDLWYKTYDYFGRFLCSIQCIEKVVRMAITVQCCHIKTSFINPSLVDLLSGTEVSDCLLPCLRTVATVEEGTVTKWDGSSSFSLVFNEEVKVKKVSVDKFSFMDSLNFFGSNLGLWPGLGLFQLLEWIVGIFLVTQILKKIKKSFLALKM